MIKNTPLYLTALLSGGLVGISLHTGWFLFVIFGCSLCCLLVYHTHPNKRSYFYIGLLFGTSKMLVVLMWGFAVYPMAWLGNFSAIIAITLIGLYWSLAAISIGLASGLAFYCLSFLPSNRYIYLFTAIALTVSESVGAIFYSVVFSGPGSYIQPYFSFGFVGYGLVLTDYFLPVAALGGVYLLSFYAFSLSAITGYAIHTKQLRYVGLLFLLLSLPAAVTLPPYERTGTVVAIINTHYGADKLQSQVGQNTKASTTIAAVATAIQSSATHIVLPEDARFVDNFPSPNIARQWLRFQTGTVTRLVLYDSSQALVQSTTVLRGYVLDSTATSSYYFDKTYLVPQGEYIPYFSDIGLWLFANPTRRAALQADFSYRPSSETYYPDDSSVASFLFCFEATNPVGVTRAQQRHRGDFIVHPVSHAWFTTSNVGLRNQLIAMLRVQSTWNRIPIVVAGNQFEGFVLYPDGEISQGEEMASDKFWDINIASL